MPVLLLRISFFREPVRCKNRAHSSRISDYIVGSLLDPSIVTCVSMCLTMFVLLQFELPEDAKMWVKKVSVIRNLCQKVSIHSLSSLPN